LYVFKHIEVDNGGHGGSLNSFSQSFHPGIAGDVRELDAAVPEPGSIVLLGLALVGLSFFARNRIRES
jgi:PEP-CTERM motif